jgi:FixJ family two-component response regulator
MLEPGSQFIQKPFDQNALLRVVREALNRDPVGHVSSLVT